MPLKLLPDVEAITIAYLVDQPDVDELVRGRVSSDIPPNAEFPRVQVNLAPMTDFVLGHFAAAVLDIHAWGETKEQASDVIRTVHAALWLPAFAVQHPGGVVTGIQERVGEQSLPDPETNRPRYVMQVAVFAHRSPVSPS